jgi:hypothetical protein
MRTNLALTLLFSLLTLASAGGASPTALDAVRALPEGVRNNLARIEAPEGNPEPTRWHVLVHDPRAENGLREYVVANGELVAARELSQFAERLSANDVIGIAAVRVNSDKLVAVAQQYAAANNVSIAAMNFELRKEPSSALPLWRIGCLDSKGQPIGSLLISADAGKIVAREGFPKTPVEPVTQLELETPPTVVQSSAPPVEASADGVKQNAASVEGSREENAAPKMKKEQAGAPDASRQKQKQSARRESEAGVEPVAEGPDGSDNRASSTAEESGKKKKSEPRKTQSVPVRRAIPVAGEPGEGNVEEAPPRRVGPLRRAARWLIPFY